MLNNLNPLGLSNLQETSSKIQSTLTNPPVKPAVGHTQDSHKLSLNSIDNHAEKTAGNLGNTELHRPVDQTPHTPHKGILGTIHEATSNKLKEVAKFFFGLFTKKPERPPTEIEIHQFAIEGFQSLIDQRTEELNKDTTPETRKTDLTEQIVRLKEAQAGRMSKLQDAKMEERQKSIDERKQNIGSASEIEREQLSIDQYELKIDRLKKNNPENPEIPKLEKAVQNVTTRLRDAKIREASKQEKAKQEKLNKEPEGMMAQVARGLNSLVSLSSESLRPSKSTVTEEAVKPATTPAEKKLQTHEKEYARVINLKGSKLENLSKAAQRFSKDFELLANDEITQKKSSELKNRFQATFEKEFSEIKNNHSNVGELGQQNYQILRNLSKQAGFITAAQEPLSFQAKEFKETIDSQVKEYAKKSIQASIKAENRADENIFAIKIDSDSIKSNDLSKSLNIHLAEPSQAPSISDLAPIFKASTPDVIPVNIQIKSDNPSISIRSSDEKKAYWSAEQPTIETYGDTNGVKIAMASGYAMIADGENTRRDRDPIVDAMVVNRFENEGGGSVLIFSGADGSGADSGVFKAATAANDGFTEHAITHLKQNAVTNTGGLAEMAVNAIAAGQKKIIETSETPNAAKQTTHLGIIASKDSQGKVSGVATSVGDMKLYILKKDGSVSEATKGNRGNSISVSDPGGQLGGVYGEGDQFADYRNLSLFFFTAEEGDILLPMSDGIHDNLDPVNNGHLTPQSAIDEMVKANVKGADQLKVPVNFKTESLELEELKNMYQAFKIEQIASEKGRDNIATNLTQYAYDLSKNLREMAASVTTVDGKQTKVAGYIDIDAYDADRGKYTGKLDHMSCGQIPL